MCVCVCVCACVCACVRACACACVSCSVMSNSLATPWTVASQASAYWSGLPFPSPGELPNPGIEPGSPALQADSLQNCSQSHQGSLICLYTCLKQQCLYFKVFTFLALLGLCCGKGSAAAVQGPHYPTDVGSQFPSVQFSCSVVSYSFRPHRLQQGRPPCPSPTPRAYSNSCLLCR